MLFLCCAISCGYLGLSVRHLGCVVSGLGSLVLREGGTNGLNGVNNECRSGYWSEYSLILFTSLVPLLIAYIDCRLSLRVRT